MTCIELCGGVHSAHRQLLTQIPVQYSDHLLVTKLVIFYLDYL